MKIDGDRGNINLTCAQYCSPDRSDLTFRRVTGDQNVWSTIKMCQILQIVLEVPGISFQAYHSSHEPQTSDFHSTLVQL